MKLTGRCYCGDIRYEFEGEVQGALHCFCRECQYITGGNSNVVMVLPDEGFQFTKGQPSTFARSDLERPVTRYFCSHCGTALGSRSPSRPGSFIVKVGTLDDPSVFKPRLSIFTVDKQAFHHVPEELPAYERRPG